MELRSAVSICAWHTPWFGSGNANPIGSIRVGGEPRRRNERILRPSDVPGGSSGSEHIDHGDSGRHLRSKHIEALALEERNSSHGNLQLGCGYYFSVELIKPKLNSSIAKGIDEHGDQVRPGRKLPEIGSSVATARRNPERKYN